MELLERYRGALVGLAIGDAMGAPVEFKLPGSFTPVTEMVGGGLFQLDPGQWTDDTSMALCLADSLIATGGFDAVDQLRRYVRWFREGYLSSTGECFDVGINTQAALLRFEQTGEAHCGSPDPHAAGNGCLMRLAPVPLAFAYDPAAAIAFAGESARTTHGAVAAVDASRYLAALIAGALHGATKAELVGDVYEPTPGFWARAPLAPEVMEVARGSFRRKNPPQIQGSGYVVRSLEAALWAFHRAEDFRDGCLRAVNLGDDADTTGAVFGQLAGAFHGLRGIPREWRMTLHQRELIKRFAERLYDLAWSARTLPASARVSGEVEAAE